MGVVKDERDITYLFIILMSVRRVIRQNKQGAKGALQAVLSVHVLD